MKKFLLTVLGLLLSASTAFAATPPLQVFQGGTGSTTLTGILIGNGTSSVRSVIIGSNLTLSGTTLSAATGGSGSFPFTSAAYGVSTSTIVGFLGGMFSVGSSTIQDLHATSFTLGASSGGLGANGGTVYVAATTTAGTGLTYTNGQFVLSTVTNTLGGTAQNSSAWSGLAAINAGTWYQTSTSTLNIGGNAGTVTNGVYTTDAGTVFLAPNGSAASLTSFPTLNQNTSGTAASLSAILVNTLGGTGKDSSSFSGLVGTNGGSWYAVASSTLSCTGAVACTSTGVSGVASSINLASIAANSVLGTQGSSGVPSAIATSSLFQTASASLSGLLSSTDWNTFNGKSGFAYPFTNGSGYFATTTGGIFNASSTIQILNTGTITIPSLGTAAGTFLAVNGAGLVIATTSPSTGVAGSGTANYVPRWTSGTAIGNSGIYDATGASGGIYIGTTTPVTVHNFVVKGGAWIGDLWSTEIGMQIIQANGVAKLLGFNERLSTRNDLLFGASDSTKQLYLSTSGNVGINTANPQATFDVQGTASSTNLQISGLLSSGLAVNSSGAVYAAATSTSAAFTYATSSLNTTGTTTISFAGFYGGTQVTQFGCLSKGGTFTSAIGTGASTSTYVVSSAADTTTYTAQTIRFTSGQRVYWAIGPGSSGTSDPSCSWVRQ